MWNPAVGMPANAALLLAGHVLLSGVTVPEVAPADTAWDWAIHVPFGAGATLAVTKRWRWDAACL